MQPVKRLAWVSEAARRPKRQAMADYKGIFLIISDLT